MIKVLTFALLVGISNAGEAGITLCNLCNGYMISKRGDGAVLIRCPGRVEPIFVMLSCKSPRVTRSGASATIHCG